MKFDEPTCVLRFRSTQGRGTYSQYEIEWNNDPRPVMYLQDCTEKGDVVNKEQGGWFLSTRTTWFAKRSFGGMQLAAHNERIDTFIEPYERRNISGFSCKRAPTERKSRRRQPRRVFH